MDMQFINGLGYFMSALAAIRRVWLPQPAPEPEPEPCRAGNIDQSSGCRDQSVM